MSVRFSFALTTSEAAAATFEPSDGTEEESDGLVLSTRRLATAEEVVELPALSVTTTRRS